MKIMSLGNNLKKIE